MPKLLIDGDVVVYRCGFAVEKSHYLVTSDSGIRGEVDNARDAKGLASDTGLIWSRKSVEPESHAIKLVNTVMDDIICRYGDSHEPVVYLSGSSNFRDGIARRAKYKGNRDAAVRPVHHKLIREHLCERYNASYTDGEEADDAIGIGMYAEPGSISVSIDKDLHQLAGRHYNWVTKEESVVSPRAANVFFYQQVLTGDPTDNVPGIKGIGPVKARALLAGCKGAKDAWRVCLDAYRSAYGADDGHAFAVETAQLVYIRRKPAEIWYPPGV